MMYAYEAAQPATVSRSDYGAMVADLPGSTSSSAGLDPRLTGRAPVAPDHAPTMPTVPGWSHELLEVVAPHVQWRHVGAGNVVFREGDPGSGAYLLREGAVMLVKEAGDGTLQAVETQRGPGIFGEMGLLSDARRAMTAIAATDLSIGYWPRDDFEAFAETEPLVASQIVRWLAGSLHRHLTKATSAVADLLAPHTPPPSHFGL